LFDPASFAPVAKILGLVALSVITDHLGTPFSLLRDDGAPVWMAEFGLDALAHEHGDERVPFRFAGQYADAETGLCYNGFRYYDPEVGGYISRDPLGLGGGPRAYGYVEDPLVALDPLGLARHITSCLDIFGDRAYFNPRFPNSYMVHNARGGEVWVNIGETTVVDAARLSIRPDPDMPVKLLVGNHGALNGGIGLKDDQYAVMYWVSDELEKYLVDPKLSRQMDKVDIIDTRDMIERRDWLAMENLIGNSEGRVVCGWCFSDRSHVVINALRRGW
jgi:RHS repeat-associated protein